jgi:hypothetical protein
LRLSLYDRILDKLARSVPGPFGGAIDLLRPSLANALGGPLNGQARRAEAVRDIFRLIDFSSIIETGTYRATTTLMLRGLTQAPIATIEADSRNYHYSRLRLLRVPDVKVIEGDSATVLRGLASRQPWNRAPAFFYLDAHWLDALPLPEELRTVTSGWSDFLILIDDFRVPGDAGYGYDDYGPGRVLEPAILVPLAGQPITVYWPAAASRLETGARRGWIVLASAGFVDERLRSLNTLRWGGTVDDALAGGT